MIAEYETDSGAAEAAMNAPEQKRIWIHGSKTIVFTGDDLPDEQESEAA